MLIYHCGLLVFVTSSLSCLVSAFSTRFMTEGVGEVKKTQAVEETKTQKMEGNNAAEEQFNPQGVAVEIIPIVSDVFTQTEDLFNMTPLKLVTTITAQHLITTVRNIAVSGNSSQDTINMLAGIVNEFNKTAQIIKLTAEYVNISGHYILSYLNQISKTGCDQKAVEEALKSVNKKLFRTIVLHIMSAFKELNVKTKQREMTGSDILVSTAYHIVTAFQEMTNQVLNLPLDSNKKCSSSLPSTEVTPSSGEQMNTVENKAASNIFTVQRIPEQGKIHKSIKKDQANPATENKMTQTNFENIQHEMTIENLNGNQDLTVEVFSPEAFIQNNNKVSVIENEDELKLKVPNDLNVQNFPPKTITLFENTMKESPNETHEKQEQTGENHKETLTQNEKHVDRELASSAADSLSNIPWISSESEAKELDKTVVINRIEKAPEENLLKKSIFVKGIKKEPQKVLNVLERLAFGIQKPGYQRPSQYQPRQKQCDEHVDPVCGIDKYKKKFIIFLNDCKREIHNRMYGTNYNWFSMDTCVGLFLHNSTLGVQFPLTSQNFNNAELTP